MRTLIILAFAFAALVTLDFWTSRRAGRDFVKSGTIFAFPLLIAMLVGAFLAAASMEGAQP